MEESKQKRIDRLYLRMAFTWSENSYAIRRKVGALIVKDNVIISDGYNGTPSGFENVCETVDSCGNKESVCNFGNDISYSTDNCLNCRHANLVTKPYVLHAESNAIAKLAKSNNSSEGATLYVTDEPCLECSKMIIQAGIRRVIYAREYRLHDGVKLLERAGIEVKQININNNEKRKFPKEDK